MLPARLIPVLFAVNIRAATLQTVFVNKPTIKASPIPYSTASRPNCGRNRPPMPYHTSEYYEAYKNTPYGWLGCNHNANASEAFLAFALKLRDEPARLQEYLRLAQRVVDHTRPVGMGFQELIMALTGTMNDLDGKETGGGSAKVDRLGAAVVLFFHPPSVRCWLDRGILREIGLESARDSSVTEGGGPCRLVRDRELLTRRGAERMILRAVGEFREALVQTLKAIVLGDKVFLFG
jgi:hypothetical protein